MTDFQDIVSENKNPVIVIDKNGVIVGVNEEFSNQYNWSSETLTGQFITAIIPKNLRDAHNLGFSRFLMDEKSTLLGKELDLEIVTGDGIVVKARHFIVAGKDRNEWAFAARITPITI